MDAKAIRSWILYDCAITPFATIILVIIMPLFFKQEAAYTLSPVESTAYWGDINWMAAALIVLFAPALGAIADAIDCKKTFLKIFTYIGVVACVFMFTIERGDWILAFILVVIASTAYSGANIFYDAFLNDICKAEYRDKISLQGYAWGYPTGGLFLILGLLLLNFHNSFGLSKISAAHIIFVSVGVCWFSLSLPLFRHVNQKEPSKRYSAFLTKRQLAIAGWKKVFKTIRKLNKYPEVLKFLVSFWFYSDGISTITVMAASYAAELGINEQHIILSVLIIQFLALPFTLLFGKIASSKSSKLCLICSLFIYLLIVFLGFFMKTALDFYILAFLISLVLGSSQAISRSIFSRIIPKKQTTEFFSLFGLTSKFGAILGPFILARIGLLTGETRYGIAALAIFFIIGIIILFKVNEEKAYLESKQ
ncbi:MAG: hypothetical protein RLZ12_433 [Bacillota bacterium]